MKIFDCFPFYNELELLDVRLHELGDVVDYFVLVEATRTHSGILKPLYFQQEISKFSSWTPIRTMINFPKYGNKIIHVIVEDMPVTDAELSAALSDKDKRWIESKYQVEDSWVRERFQRNAIMRSLNTAKPDDVIIIGDADEIMRRSVIEKIRSDGKICEGSNAVQQQLNSYYFNVRCTNMPWWGSKIIYRKYLDDYTPSEVRFHVPASCSIENGGWHFNFFGGSDRVQLKIKSYAHQEFNKPDVLENVSNHLNGLTDVLGRLYQYETFEMTEETTPKYVLDNQKWFDGFIYHEIS